MTLFQAISRKTFLTSPTGKRFHRGKPKLCGFPFLAYICLTLGIVLSPVSARAGFITTNEAGMDAIFSQASFGTTPIDIRYNAAARLSAAALLSIDTQAEWTTLVGKAPNASPTVDTFYVDAVK